MNSAFLFECHPISRFLAGGGLIAMAIGSRSILLSLFLAALAAFLIRFIEGNWLTMLRLSKLLGWFIVPILLLHALFSPGQLLFPGTAVPVTEEGLHLGLLLSTRLAAMFTAAMLMFRMLSQSEWLRAIVAVPLLGKRLLPFIWMIRPMQRQVGFRLRLIQRQYGLRRHWRMLPQVLLSACAQALAAATPVSRTLWLRWPVQVELHSAYRPAGMGARLTGLLLGIIGLTCMMLAWI